MENVTDALYIAVAVLIFIVAISITINSFTETSVAATTILNNRDREYDYTYVEDNGTTDRTVSVEDMIPAIYKAFKENYKIVFGDVENGYVVEGGGRIRSVLPEGVYQANLGRAGSSEWVNVYKLELGGVVRSNDNPEGRRLEFANDNLKEQFISGVLYGNNSSDETFLSQSFYKLNSQGLYDIILGHTFIEHIGIYYQDTENNDDNQQQNMNESEVPDANRKEKKIITYELIS